MRSFVEFCDSTDGTQWELKRDIPNDALADLLARDAASATVCVAEHGVADDAPDCALEAPRLTSPFRRDTYPPRKADPALSPRMNLLSSERDKPPPKGKIPSRRMRGGIDLLAEPSKPVPDHSGGR